MRKQWKNRTEKIVSLVLAVTMVLSQGQGISAKTFAPKEEVLQYLESSRLPQEKLPEGDCIYFGTSAAEVEERGTYALRLYREGDLEKRASVELHSIDMTALYGKDYEFVMEDIEKIGDGKTILEKQMKGKKIEEADEQVSLPLDGRSQTEEESPEITAFTEEKTADTAAKKSSLARTKEEQTGRKTRELADAGEDEEVQGLADSLMGELVNNSMECLDASAVCRVDFAPGEAEKIVKFRVLEDEKSEGTELFSIAMADAKGTNPYEVTSASISIRDDEKAVRSKVSFSKSKYESKDGKAVLKVCREGAEYSLCDMVIYTSGDTAKAGDNYREKYDSLTFSPYEMEKEIEIPVTGEGVFRVFLSDFQACTEGKYSKAEVVIETKDGKKATGDSGDKAVVKTSSRTKKRGSEKDDDGMLSFGISINNKGYTVKYKMNEKSGKIMDTSYDPPVEVGVYYFSSDQNHGGIFTYGDKYLFGAKPYWCGRWESSYQFDNGKKDSMGSQHFGKLEYYHTFARERGGAWAESAREIPGLYYQYFVSDWKSKSGDFGGQRAKLEIFDGNNVKVDEKIDGKFDRSQDKAPVKNTREEMLYARVVSVDEHGDKTPKNYVEFYGLCAMYKKYNVSLLPVAEKKYRTGTEDSHLETKPLQIELNCGAQVLYDNESRNIYANPDEQQTNLVFTVKDTQLGSENGKFGHITGYEISIDPANADQKQTVAYPQDFVTWLQEKKGSASLTDKVSFSSEAVDNEIKKVNANIDTVPYDGYFVCWIDSIQKDTKSDGHGYMQNLKFRPLIDYNDVTVEVLSPKGEGAGHFKDNKLSKNGKYQFHAGDSLDLSAVAEDGDNYHVAGYEVSVNGGISYNAITDGSYLMLKSDTSYQIRPIIQENTNGIELRFQDKAGDYFEVQGLIDQKKLEPYPEYRGKNILNLNPKADTVREMMEPVVGKEYTIRIAVKSQEAGKVHRPKVKMKSQNTVYTTQAFTMVAAADTADNIVEVGLQTVKESDLHKYTVKGTLVSAFAPIRSTGQDASKTELPVSNYTLSAGTGKQSKDEKTGTYSIETVSSTTGSTGEYTLPDIQGCNGDVIPVLISNGTSNGQVVEVTLTNSNAFDGGYQVTKGNTRLTYPYQMPEVTSITYSYENNAHNQITDNRDNSIRLFDDALNVTAKVNPYGRKIKEAVFTVYTVTGAVQEYHVKESEDNKNTFVCRIPKMLENLHNGDRMKVRLVDAEEKVTENSEIILDDQGKEITGMTVAVQYPDVETGLVFYIENVLLAPQTYDMDKSQPVNIPLLGATSANANSGLITFGKMKWPDGTGFTYHVGIDAMISNTVAPNTVNKLAKMHKFENDVAMAASGKSGDTSEDIMYKTFTDNKDASLKDSLLKDEKAQVQEMVAKTKEDPGSSAKNAAAGLNSNAMMSLDVGFMLSFNYVLDPVRQEYIFAGGGVCVGGTFTFNKTLYAVVECIPMFLNLTSTLQLGTAISYPSSTGKNALTAGDFDSYSGNIAERLEETVSSLSLMISGKVQVGVGLCGILSARGYASTKLQFDVGITHANSGLLMEMAGGFGIDMVILSMNYDVMTGRVGFGTLEKKAGFDFFGGLLSVEESADSDRLKTSGKKKAAAENEKYTVHPYSAGTSDMADFGKGDGKRRAALEQVSVTTLLDNAAERTRPRMIPLDGGKKMIIFLGNRGDKDSLNRMALYYSLYDGGKWSQPEMVCEDGTVDSMPDILRVKNKVIIAWADASRAFTAQDTSIDKLNTMGISLAIYDIATGKMSKEVNLLQDDKYLNLSPRLNVDGSTVYCSYMKRDLTGAKEEELLDFKKIYSTMAYISYDYEKQEKQTETLIEISHDTMDDPLVMDYNSIVTQVDGESYMLSAYTIDEDNDLNTGEDKELYLEIFNLTTKKNYYPICISNDTINQSNPKLTDIDGTVYLTWLDSGYLFQMMDASRLLKAFFDKSSSTVSVPKDGDGSTGEMKAVTVNKDKYINGNVDGAVKNRNWYQQSAESLGLEKEYYDGSIYEAAAQGDFQTASANLAQNEGVNTCISSYKLTTNGDDIYIFFTDFGAEQESTGMEIYGARYQRMLGTEDGKETEGMTSDDRWGFGKAVQITDNNKVIDEMDLYMTEDGRVSAVSNYYDQWIDKDGMIQYGANQLVEIEFGTANSLEVKDGMIILPTQMVGGETDQISFGVKNNGLLTAAGFDYTVSQISGDREIVIDKNHVETSLDAGESTEVTVPWKIPENVSDTSIRVRISESGIEHSKPVIEEKKLPCESKLQFLESRVLWRGMSPYVQTVVKNTGNVASKEYQGTLSKLKKVEQNGHSWMEEEKIYESFTVPALSSGEEKTIKISFAPSVSDYGSQGIIDLKLDAGEGKESAAESYMKLSPVSPVCAQINGGKKSVSLSVGKKTALQTEAAPWNEIAGPVSYYSSDESVAVVDKTGSVTGIKAGKAAVYAYYPNTGVSASIDVTVTDSSSTPPGSSSTPAPKSGTDKIKLAKKSLTVVPGKTKGVGFTALPSSGSGKTAGVTVSVSGNKNVTAKISAAKVKVTAKKKAERGSSATVTLKSKNASGKTVKAALKVKVQNKVKKVVPAAKSVTLKKGKTKKLTLKVTAQNQKKASTDKVKLSSSLVDITKTSVKKKKITVSLRGKKKGKKKATIQVGSKKVKITVKVR